MVSSSAANTESWAASCLDRATAVQKAAEHGPRCGARSVPVAQHDPLYQNCKSGLRLNSELRHHLNLDGTLDCTAALAALGEDVVPEPPKAAEQIRPLCPRAFYHS